MNNNNEKNEDVIQLHSFGKRYYRVRITANPADPKTVDLAEDLLSKCGASRCESSTDEGISIWSLIVDEEFVDDALKGIAVVANPDFEFFETDEGQIYVVSETDCYQLRGYAEESALCWEGEELIEFDFAVSRIIGDQMNIQMEELLDSISEDEAELLPEVAERVWTLVSVHEWGEEDVREAIQEVYKEVLAERDHEKGGN